MRDRDPGDVVLHLLQEGRMRCRGFGDGFCHAGRTFGVRLIRVSSPVRNAAATGPGTALMQPEHGPGDRRRDRSRQPPDAQRVATGPRRIGVGEMVRVGEFVDGSRADRSTANARSRRRSPISPPGGSGTRSRSPSDAIIGWSSDSTRSAASPPGTGQGDRGQHRRHAGIHATDRHTSPPLARRAAICGQQLA